MKLGKKIKAAMGGIMMLAATSASATLITANGNAAAALSLSESFESFYSLGIGNTYSANTGLEIANTAVAFLAESAGDLGLFVIFSDFGGLAGSVNLDVFGTSGAVSFTDDPAETVVGTNLVFNYAKDKTDGFIFSGMTGAEWSVDVIFNSLVGVNSLTFLTFDAAGNDSVLFETSNPSSLNVQASPVSAPLMGFLTIALIGGLLARSRKA